jgi:SsrA-binding protein
MAPKSPNTQRVVAKNRRARHDYTITDTVEAGLILTGSEVKSLRAGHASIQESYAGETDGELFLINAQINEYSQANRFNHDPKRPRKLLLKKRELSRLLGAISKKGVTLIPLSLYFNAKGLAKLEIGLAVGKNKADKRETEKKRDWQ